MKDPHWSADGRRIVYVAENFDVNHVWSMRADGSDKRRLFGSDRYPEDPDWQPLP